MSATTSLPPAGAAVPAGPLLAGSLATNPRLGDWLSIHPDGTVSVRTGKVELGQGIITALAQIVSEELGVAASRIRMYAASTAAGPNEGMTAGSMSIAHSGAALRQACAEARRLYLHAAAVKLGLDQHMAAELSVVDGSFLQKGTVPAGSYWALADDALLDREATGGVPPLRPEAARETQQVQRLDLPDKVSGRPRFIQDMVLPGMLYGRVAHPPSAGATLITLDPTPVQAMPGVVAVVRDGSFLGVVADDEYLAVKALEKLVVLARWQEVEGLPDMNAMPAFLRAQPADSSVVGEKKPEGASPAVARTFQAAYSRPYLAHASIGPSCAIACHQDGRLEVWTHSQGIYNLRADLALVLEMPQDHVTLRHAEGAGCYGHNGADDAAGDAALLARAVPGRPVQLQWTREDELGCAPFGAAMAVEIRAGVDSDGRIVDWQHDVWSNGHSMRPGRSKIPVLHAATQLAQPFERQVAINVPLANGGGAERNSVPFYDFAQWRAVCHRSLNMPIRTSSLRSLGAHCNVFAIESFLDEIASGLGVDPLEFRLRHLADPRGREVLAAAAAMSGWSGRQKAEGKGTGLAFSRYKNMGAYCAVVAAVDVSHEVRVERLWVAVDVGRVVNLDGVINQMEGGAIQTVSWVLKEAVQFDHTRILSTTWDHYPILRFTEVPAVEVKVLDRPGEKSLGAGEATHGPVAAAIANAIADALGVRVRDMPLNTDNITKAALAE
ncbi:MAG: xanthine dehydrogenase family protein molybdopterin-binding subunit [Polaromonas sp.]|nr:xanthine dehydrogenase family protein molybdopterin-binding subunit [Polaromonas sp.]